MDYASLKALIAGHMHRNDMGGVIPSMIELAEARFNRELRTPYQETTAYATMTGEYIGLPTDPPFLAMRRVVRDSDGRMMNYERPVDYIDYIDDSPLSEYAVTDTNIVPIWTLEDMQIRVYPHPTESVPLTVRIVYYAKIPALSDAAPSNWLLESHPDVYVAAACLGSRQYIRADQQQFATWTATLTETMASLNKQRTTALTPKSLRTELPAIRRRYNVLQGW